jgi:hypothetical protein
VQLGCCLGSAFAYAEIDQAFAQVGLFDPLRHRRVESVRHQQRESEVVQQALGHTFPVALVVAHLQQFAGEGQFRFIQLQCLA